MKMVSMEQKPEMKIGTEAPCCMEEPKYPYGLRINLCDEQLVALGITSMPAVGSEMLMQCKVKVTGCRQEETAEEGTETHVDLQIIEMGTEGPAKGMFDHPSRIKE